MYNKIYIILFSLIFSGCSEFDKAEYIRKDRIGREKLINTIFSNADDDYLTLNCIREKDHHLQSILNEEENIISRHLGLKTEEQLTTILDLNEEFKWNRRNVQNKKILTEEELEVFQDETDPAHLDFRNLSECPEGYLTISKPVFNEDFNKAIVHTGRICGFLCGSGEYRLYVLEDGIWKFEKVVSSWVS